MSGGGWEVDIPDYIKDIPMQSWSSSAPAWEHNPSVLWIPRARQMPESLFLRPGTRHPMTAGVTTRPLVIRSVLSSTQECFPFAFFSSPASPLVSKPCGELQSLWVLDKETLSLFVKGSGWFQSWRALVTVRVKCRGREDCWTLISHVKHVCSAVSVRSSARAILTEYWAHMFRLLKFA